jgi:hypothetical protein
MAEGNDNDVKDYIRQVMAEEKKKKTAVGSVMENGGGAAIGATVGYTAGTVAAVALAPITGGLSILVAPLFGIAGGVMGHRAAKDMD